MCEGAFESLMGGDPERHDKLVSDALKQLAGNVDVIVLAQASMARVAENLDSSDCPVPILTSPGIAIDYLATVL